MMDQTTLQRGQMALIGAVAGLSFYGLSRIIESTLLGDRGLLTLCTFAVSFFTGLLALSGPLTLSRASLSALALAVLTTLLFLWSSFRFATLDQFFAAPFPVLATGVIATVPLPFIVAAAGLGWRDYPALFSAAWTIAVRYAAAWVFVGVVWAVILLSNELLSIVGLTFIEDLIETVWVPFVVTGVTLGLGLAVVQELKEFVSPYLILRLLRLLLPVVLVVLLVFVAALPFQGLSGLFGGLSVAATLLGMTAAAATLITTAIDQDDTEATQSPLLARSTQMLALILPVPAGLAAYSIWLRVDQYGWTPDRLFAAAMAVLALGYGLLYFVAVVRRRAWMERIRHGNINMALCGILLAILWLTPVLNAERISANSLTSRYLSGKTSPDALDVQQLAAWGLAGAASLALLTDLAKDPGQETLAKALAASADPRPPTTAQDPETLLADLRTVLPLQPPDATEDRDRLLAGVQPYELESWLRACRLPMPDTGPGCVMVVADFIGIHAGNEAIIVTRDIGDSMRYDALVEINGTVELRAVSALEGYLPYDATGAALISQLQSIPPNVTPAPLSQLNVGGRAIVVYP